MRFFSPKFKQRWLDALRSGRYELGTESLTYTDTVTGRERYSPLGVLAKLYKKLNKHGWFYHQYPSGRTVVGSPHTLQCYNPETKDFEFFFGLGPKTQEEILHVCDQKGVDGVVKFVEGLKTGVEHP